VYFLYIYLQNFLNTPRIVNVYKKQKQNDKNAILQKNRLWFLFRFLGNVLIGAYTTYMQNINNVRLVVYSPAYCFNS